MKSRLSPTKIILLGFLISAFAGSILLWGSVNLFSEGKLPYIDSLFTAVTSICVTGLSTINIGKTFSPAGQVILLLMIQVGGLGVITFTTMILLAIGEKLSLQDKILLQNAYNVDSMKGLGKLTKNILKAAFLIEGIGALGYAFVFVPRYGITGIWYSVFHSVSAYCNAGIDLLGGNSLSEYTVDVWANLVTMFLIIAGGLGFPVYWDFMRVFRERKTSRRGIFRSFSLHTRLVLILTGGLIFGGMLITMLFEWNNPATLGSLSVPEKLLASLFQSVTLRTAGFSTIDQGAFRSCSCFIYLLFMLIGGSPAGTAGGVKTVTLWIIIASMISNIRGEKECIILKRTIDDKFVRKSSAIVSFCLLTAFVLTGAFLAVEQFELTDAIYEVISAIATVGLSRGITGQLGNAGKILIMAAMYLGRVGPISLALAFNSKRIMKNTKYAEEKVVIG